MAGTVQPAQLCSDAGITPTDIHASITATNEAPINTKVLMFVTAGGSAVNITLNTYVTVDGQLATDRVINVPAGTTKVIGPIPMSVYSLGDGNFEFDVDVPANIAKMWLIEMQ